MKRALITTIMVVAVLALVCSWAVAEEEESIELKTDKEKVSYAIGVQIGESMKNDDLDINVDVLSRALSDVFNDKSLAMSEEEIMKTMKEFQQEMMKKQREAMEKEAQENIEEAEEFLEENKKKENVKVMDSGLQYMVIEKGTGESPGDNDRVKVKYTGSFINGEVFDSTEQRGGQPATFSIKGVVPGMSEALENMKVGGKWKIFIPPELGYGAQGGGGRIPPNALLIFDVELVDIVEGSQSNQPQPKINLQ